MPIFDSNERREPLAQPGQSRKFHLAPEPFAAYKEWKESVPAPVRSLVEGTMMGKAIRIDAREELPSVAHRAPTQESEGIPEYAIVTVGPFFGGYTDAAFDLFDPATLTWKKSLLFASSLSFDTKARLLASHIHKQLEYDMDPKWDTIYKAHRARYFELIWEHKKAKCDEANTMLTRLLTKVGVRVRFMRGHEGDYGEQEAELVSHVGDLAKKGLEQLSQRIKEAYSV